MLREEKTDLLLFVNGQTAQPNSRCQEEQPAHIMMIVSLVAIMCTVRRINTRISIKVVRVCHVGHGDDDDDDGASCRHR